MKADITGYRNKMKTNIMSITELESLKKDGGAIYRSCE